MLVLRLTLFFLIFVTLNHVQASPRALQSYRFDDMSVVIPLGAVKASTDLWEDGVLPLVFDKGISAEKQKLLFDSCYEWTKVANVQCVSGSYKKRKLTVTQNLGNGCWASWGMSRHALLLQRRMNLSKSCWTRATLLHELGHALGLIHEHQRPDRDQFVTIHEENIKPSFLALNTTVNFEIQKAQLETPYDFLSIMHYPRRAFSKNGFDTIVPKAPYIEFLNSMGQGSALSEGDVQTMRSMYGPPIR
jgi:hypothetical protein